MQLHKVYRIVRVVSWPWKVICIRPVPGDDLCIGNDRGQSTDLLLGKNIMVRLSTALTSCITSSGLRLQGTQSRIYIAIHHSLAPSCSSAPLGPREASIATKVWTRECLRYVTACVHPQCRFRTLGLPTNNSSLRVSFVACRRVKPAVYGIWYCL